MIDPFEARHLGSTSYDITLGEFFYREQHHGGGVVTFNPYAKDGVNRVWGKKWFRAQPLKSWLRKTGVLGLDGIRSTDKVIWIEPGETILAHTQEFIGGRICVTTMMKARSSLGRCFIEIAKCAGWGDLGYINRWTMEVTNNSRYYSMPLVVNRRIGQITFFEVEPVASKFDYARQGKYQQTDELEKIKSSWQPEMMLPRLYMDYEVDAKK